jgi:RNA polymerase sigma factor FliA
MNEVVGATVRADEPVRTAQAPSEALEEHLDLVRVVVSQVAMHFPRHVDREELAGAGTVGLVEAGHRYDASRGVPFHRFAARRIRGAILDATRSADWAPRSVRAFARDLESTTEQLTGDLGRPPSQQELAHGMGTTTRELGRLQGRVHRSVLLALEPGTADGEDDRNLADGVVDTRHLDPSEELELRELHAHVRHAVTLLPDRHRLVIRYFLEGRSLAEPARLLGVTRSRVSQLRGEALAMLKAGIIARFGEGSAVPQPTAAGVAAPPAASLVAAAGATREWHMGPDSARLAA